jgi:glutamate N-acetyltransferase/amino-acid N-acetyltransferase
LELALKIPTDGEGATHLIHIQVAGADNDHDADRIARTIALSNLVKTAVAGGDPNWGRIVSAAGYAGVPVAVEQMNLHINGLELFRAGQPVPFQAAEVSRSIKQTPTTSIVLCVGQGSGQAQHWTSDLTADYVKLNADYTT